MAADVFSDNSCEDPVLEHICFDDKDVLEIGGGFGGFTLAYLTNVKYLLCIDTHSEAINCLRAEWDKCSKNSLADFCVGDITSSSLPVKSFDIAVFSHSF